MKSFVLFLIIIVTLVMTAVPVTGSISVKEIYSGEPFAVSVLFQTVPVGWNICVEGPDSAHEDFPDTTLPVTGLPAPGEWALHTFDEPPGWNPEDHYYFEARSGYTYFVTINPVIDKWGWIED